MIRRLIFLLLAALLLLTVPGLLAQAQSEAECAALVASALQTVSDVCSSLGRNEACYGNNHVDATFWQAADDLRFSFPGSRVPLADLHTVATSPLNLSTQVWGVAAIQLHAADLPETLPGQAVTFLLMGDTEIENAVSPEQAALPVTPVRAVTNAEVDLRGVPTDLGNIQGRLPAGTNVQLVGVDETNAWAEVLLRDGGEAWVAQAQLDADAADLADLPVTYGANTPPRYGPMQAFYFTTGLGEAACHEAPDALLVQSPQRFEVTLNVNQLEVQVGSTVLLARAAGPRGVPVMVIVLLEGGVTFTLDGEAVTLSTPGQAAAITLNADGRVDAESALVEGNADRLGGLLHNACEDALQAGFFERLDFAAACDAYVTFPYSPPPATQIVPQAAACAWPIMTSPISGTNFVGNDARTVTFAPVAGINRYQWFVQGDLHDYYATGTSDQTAFTLNMSDMPSGPRGLGYWLWAAPLDAQGNPLCPPGRSPHAIWISKDLGGPPTPIPACGNQYCDFGEDRTCPRDCGTMICGDGWCVGSESYANCPGDCPHCGDGTCDPGLGEDLYNCPADC